MFLKDKIAVVTGGFGGIGYEICRQLLVNGIKAPAIFDIQEREDKLLELCENFQNAVVRFYRTDVGEKSQLVESYRKTVEDVGNFDLVINSSGIMNENLIEETVTTNLTGTINSSLIANDYLSKSNAGSGGLIVNISSVAGLQPFSATAVYCATKHGIVGFTRSLADPQYFNNSGVAFVTICPGFTETNIIKSTENRINRNYPVDIASSKVNAVKTQTVEECVDKILEAINIGKNGSLWVIDLGELSELNLPRYWNAKYEA